MKNDQFYGILGIISMIFTLILLNIPLSMSTIHSSSSTHSSSRSITPLRASFQKYYRGGETSLMKDIVDRLEWSELSALDNIRTLPTQYHNYEQFNALGKIIQCPKELLHSYGQGDGEKRICGDMYSKEYQNNCLIISLGSHNVWHFEEAIIAKHANCTIHTFDCFNPGTVPKKLEGSVTSHHICIGPHDEILEGKQFLTWESILKKINAREAPTALKMDIEGFEWLVLREMMVSSPVRLLPYSIAFEIHSRTGEMGVPWRARNRNFAEIALFMDYLMKFGYVLVDRHDNPFCKACSEVVIGRIGDCVIRK